MRGRCVGATSNGKGRATIIVFGHEVAVTKQHKMQPTDFFDFTPALPAPTGKVFGSENAPQNALKTLTLPPPARSPRRPAQSPARVPPSSPVFSTRTTSRTRNQPPRRTQRAAPQTCRTGSAEPTCPPDYPPSRARARTRAPRARRRRPSCTYRPRARVWRPGRPRPFALQSNPRALENRRLNRRQPRALRSRRSARRRARRGSASRGTGGPAEHLRHPAHARRHHEAPAARRLENSDAERFRQGTV